MSDKAVCLTCSVEQGRGNCENCAEIRAAEERRCEAPGSKDGTGAGDHDQPYTFGRKPTVQWSFPFVEREFARLLTFRSRVADQQLGKRMIDPDD